MLQCYHYYNLEPLTITKNHIKGYIIQINITINNSNIMRINSQLVNKIIYGVAADDRIEDKYRYRFLSDR